MKNLNLFIILILIAGCNGGSGSSTGSNQAPTAQASSSGDAIQDQEPVPVTNLGLVKYYKIVKPLGICMVYTGDKYNRRCTSFMYPNHFEGFMITANTGSSLDVTIHRQTGLGNYDNVQITMKAQPEGGYLVTDISTNTPDCAMDIKGFQSDIYKGLSTSLSDYVYILQEIQPSEMPWDSMIAGCE